MKELMQSLREASLKAITEAQNMDLLETLRVKYLGFTGILTFKNAKKALRALSVIPVDRFVLETDCPYMAPVPYRGKRCDSRMIIETAKAFGTAAVAMNSKAIGADLTIAWENAEIGAMNAKDAAMIMYDGQGADVINEKIY